MVLYYVLFPVLAMIQYSVDQDVILQQATLYTATLPWPATE
jgi:hypothetical protein